MRTSSDDRDPIGARSFLRGLTLGAIIGAIDRRLVGRSRARAAAVRMPSRRASDTLESPGRDDVDRPRTPSASSRAIPRPRSSGSAISKVAL